MDIGGCAMNEWLDEELQLQREEQQIPLVDHR